MNQVAKNAASKRTSTRNTLWPNSEAWVFIPGHSKGFAQIPRVVPLVARLINELGGKENAGSLYQVLWSHDWGQGIVEIRNSKALLYEAGYATKGGRAERTWRERLAILRSLWLVVPGGLEYDDESHLLLIDPHLAVLELQCRRNQADAKIPASTFDPWFRTFSVFCEAWGVDLAQYSQRLQQVKLAHREAVNGS